MHDVKLLIVDDDEDDYLLAKDLLDDITRGPYEIDWASSYEEGEEALRENRHDLCLMDYNLGARDGIKLLRAAHDLGFNGPIILLTGMDQGEVDMQALEAGAVDYLVKANLTAEQLARSIRYALARKDMERERVERLRAEAESRSKSEFLAHLSHELRTPLSAILGFTELLLNRRNDKEDLSYLQVVHRNGKHLLGLLNDILDLSKVEAGKLEIEVETVHLAPFLADIYSLMYGAAVDKNLKLRLVVPDLLPKHIQTDPTRLRQVLLNLMGNAIKFTDRGEVVLFVRIDEEAERARIHFSVMDTGMGIATGSLENIFQPFVQTREAAAQARTGTGLGLTISQQLVQRLGGRIQVRSESGKGSEFGFVIDPGDLSQIEREPFTLDCSSQKELHGAIPQFSGRVLVVDDLRDIRLLIGHFVQSTGLEVTYARNGQEAMQVLSDEAAQGRYCDLVLMDIHMPVLNGIATAQALRAQGFDRPLVALTAANMKGDRESYLESGFSACLSKPIDQGQLHTCMAQFLAAKSPGVEASSDAHQVIDSKESVLVVEDSVDTLRATRALLEFLGWQVITACDATTAIAQVQKHRPTKALVDLNLPDMSGYELTKVIREMLPDIEIFIASGSELEPAVAAKVGISASLMKPITLDSLQEVLRHR